MQNASIECRMLSYFIFTLFDVSENIAGHHSVITVQRPDMCFLSALICVTTFHKKQTKKSQWCSQQIVIFDLIADFPLTGRPGLLQGGRASYWEARASHRDALPLTGRPGLSLGAEPLAG